MDRLSLAKRLAEEAAMFLRASFRGVYDVSEKPDGSIVTAVDREAEKRICDAIAEAFPEDAIVAEESEGCEGTSGMTWYLDPIDGTTNFSHGIPIFANSLAYADARGPLGAAVAIPFFGTLFVAERGRGAWRFAIGGKEETGEALHVRSMRDERSGPLILLSFSDREDPRITALLTRKPHLRLRILGSVVVSLCVLAAGGGDGGIFLAQHPWDYAAGMLIAQEAGARLAAFDGGPLHFPAEKDMLVSSEEGFDALLSIVRTL
jgi:fructose-1,6-bisphosphatase/inositol monophosphatase family enzyme